VKRLPLFNWYLTQTPLRFASPRVSRAAKKQADAAGDVLNCVNKRSIDFYFEGRQSLPHCAACQHREGLRQ